MPRKPSSGLTDAELRLMQVLWKRGAATVAEVLADLEGGPAVAYSTVLTMLRILETKGYLKHKKSGKAFVYRPVVARDQARHSAVSQLLRRFFDGSPELLMLNLIDDSKLSLDELARLRRRIAEQKEDA